MPPPALPGLRRWRALHWAALGLTVATFVAYGRGCWSWRGQWPEAALFGAAWGSAAWLWLGHRRALRPAGKWYFGGAALFPLLPFVGWLPAAYALLPNPVLYQSPAFALRDQNRGFLDGRRLALILPVAGVGEQLVAYSADWPQRTVLRPPLASGAGVPLPGSLVLDSVALDPRPGGGYAARLFAGGCTYEASFVPSE